MVSIYGYDNFHNLMIFLLYISMSIIMFKLKFVSLFSKESKSVKNSKILEIKLSGKENHSAHAQCSNSSASEWWNCVGERVRNKFG